MFQLNLVLSVVFLQVLFLSEASSGRVQRATETSKTDVSNWKTLVKDLTETLSSNVDPCRDFHSYVCRKYDEPEADYDFTKMLILEPYLKKGEGLNEAEMKAKNYMYSCLHKTNENLRKFVKNFNFEKSIGGWPAFDSNWNSENFNWQAAIAEFATHHIWLPINALFMNYVYDSHKKYLHLQVQAEDFYLGNHESQFRLNNLLVKFGVPDVNAVLNDVRQFEEKYRAADLNVAWDAHTVKTNFSSLKAEIPELDWDKYFETTERRKLPEDFSVHLVKGDVLKRALTTLSKMDPKVFANYLFCHFLLDYPYNEIQPSKEECWQRTYNNFRAVLSQTILNKFVSEDLKGKVMPLLNNYVDTLYKYLPPPESKSDTIKTKYLKEILEDYFASITDDGIAKEYKDLSIDPNSYCLNSYTMSRHNYFKEVESRWNEKSQWSARVEQVIAADFPQQMSKANIKLWASVYGYFAFYYLYEHLEAVDQDYTFSNSLSDCFDEVVDKQLVKDAVTLQILTKTFIDWEGKNEDAIKAENDLFKENGLSLKKALFIGIMRFWCGESKFKFNLMFSKSKEFGDTFSCSAGTPMNPGEKCDIDKFEILA